MAKNVLQKTSGLLVIPVYVPDQPGYSGGSVPQPRQDNYQLPPISYDPGTGLFEVGGAHFETYESLTGYVMSTLWQQQGGMGYGYDQGFFVVGIEQAQNSNIITNTVQLSNAFANPFIAATQDGQAVTRLSNSVFTGVRPVTYGAPSRTYSAPTGSGIDMTNTGEAMMSYLQTQFNKSDLYTL